MDPVNILAKFEVRSFIRSWDNRGYSKKLGSPCIRPRSIFSQIFNRLLFAWTIWIYLPNVTFVVLPIPEIIGGTSKIWRPWICPRSLFSQIFKGLLFAWTLWIYLPSFKFIALPVPEIIGGTQKNWAVPGYAHAPFSPKFFMGLCSDGSCECIGQICSP